MLNFTDLITNFSETANGALTNASTMEPQVDLFSGFVSASLLNRGILVEKALRDNRNKATKIIFYLRDPRGGMGNKDAIQYLFKNLSKDEIIALIPYIVEHGSFKDLNKLFGLLNGDVFPVVGLDKKELKKIKKAIIKFYYDEIQNGNGLACKWFPRRGTMFKKMAKWQKIPYSNLRKMLVSGSKTVEQLISAKKWHEVNYSSVPSVANKMYSKAFMKHDEARRMKFFNEVMEGSKKMNADLLYPHEIYKMSKSDPDSANALWESLDKKMKIKHKVNILPVVDTSGSMNREAYGKYSAMDIGNALGIYFAERNRGDWHNLLGVFSSKTEFFNLKGNTLFEKKKSIPNLCCSTNLQIVFDRILDATEKGINPPDAILIISDMEFNQVINNHSQRTNFAYIEDEYKKAGIDRPTIIFWKVNALVDKNQPVTYDERGAILINGYSPAVMDLIVQMDMEKLSQITPQYFVEEAIKNYSFVDEVIK